MGVRGQLGLASFRRALTGRVVEPNGVAPFTAREPRVSGGQRRSYRQREAPEDLGSWAEAPQRHRPAALGLGRRFRPGHCATAAEALSAQCMPRGDRRAKYAHG